MHPNNKIYIKKSTLVVLFLYIINEQNYKPGYVELLRDDHLSSSTVANRLKRPT